MKYHLDLSDVRLDEEWETSYTHTNRWWVARVSENLKDEECLRNGPYVSFERVGATPDEATENMRAAMAENGWELL